MSSSVPSDRSIEAVGLKGAVGVAAEVAVGWNAPPRRYRACDCESVQVGNARGRGVIARRTQSIDQPANISEGLPCRIRNRPQRDAGLLGLSGNASALSLRDDHCQRVCEHVMHLLSDPVASPNPQELTLGCRQRGLSGRSLRFQGCKATRYANAATRSSLTCHWCRSLNVAMP